jgi:hypothetical protein
MSAEIVGILEGYTCSGLQPPCLRSQRPLPDAAQDLVRGCSLGFAAAAISGD